MYRYSIPYPIGTQFWISAQIFYSVNWLFPLKINLTAFRMMKPCFCWLRLTGHLTAMQKQHHCFILRLFLCVINYVLVFIVCVRSYWSKHRICRKYQHETFTNIRIFTREIPIYQFSVIYTLPYAIMIWIHLLQLHSKIKFCSPLLIYHISAPLRIWTADLSIKSRLL